MAKMSIGFTKRGFKDISGANQAIVQLLFVRRFFHEGREADVRCGREEYSPGSEKQTSSWAMLRQSRSFLSDPINTNAIFNWR